MRIECDSCKELVVAGFAVEGGAVRATCPVCRHTMTAPPPAVAAAGEQAPCPKCGAVRTAGATACATCGLSVARMAAYTEAQAAAVPEPVQRAWTRAAERWDDPARHDELLQLVAAHSCYAWAAGRYRTRRDAIAQRQLERLRRAAEATLLAGATARPDATARPYRAARSVLAILVVTVVVALVYGMVMRDGPVPPPARSTAPAAPTRPLSPGHPVSPGAIR